MTRVAALQLAFTFVIAALLVVLIGPHVRNVWPLMALLLAVAYTREVVDRYRKPRL